MKKEIRQKGDELHIIDPFAAIHERSGEVENHEGMVRVYRDSPSTVTLQIRACSKLNPCGKGKERNFYSNSRLGVEEIDALIAKLEEVKAELLN